MKKRIILLLTFLISFFIFSVNTNAEENKNDILIKLEGKKIEKKILEKKTEKFFLARKRNFGGGLFKTKKTTSAKKDTKKTNTAKKDIKNTDSKKSEKKGGFLGGILGGVLVGTLLGSLLGAAFGGGFGTFLMLIILAILGFFLYKFFKNKKEVKKNDDIEKEVERRMKEKENYIDVEEVK